MAIAVVGAAVGLFAGPPLLRRINGPLPIAAPSQPQIARVTSQTGVAGSPSWSPDGSEIIYASNVAGTMDLWRQETDGRIRLIIDLPGSETDPDWAPDDSAVAYTSNFGTDGIWIVSPHGGTPRQVTSFGARPRWSPDSSKIVFDWRGVIYLVDAQPGAQPQSIVSDTAGSPHPAWSHDGTLLYYWDRSLADVVVVAADGGGAQVLALVPAGQEIAGLATSRDGRFLIMSRGPYGGNKDIWRVTLDSDGGVSGPAVRLTAPTTDDVDPAVSPDGSRLAYAARHIVRQLESFAIDPATGRAAGSHIQLTSAADSNYYPAVSADGMTVVWTAHRTSGQGLLYSLNLRGPVAERKVTTVWERSTREIGGTFSPTGSDLLFTSTARGSYELWHLASCLHDCVPVQVTTTEHPVRDVMPTWSPRNGRIAFYSNRSGNWDIWSLALGNGEAPHRLTDALSFEMYPAFSPDGTQIVYWTNQAGGGGDIWMMDANGANQRPVVVDPAEEGWAAWSRNGRWLYFTSDRSGSFNVWAQSSRGGAPFQITTYTGLSEGLPESVIYTKFAVTDTELVVPVEQRSGGLWILENLR